MITFLSLLPAIIFFILIIMGIILDIKNGGETDYEEPHGGI